MDLKVDTCAILTSNEASVTEHSCYLFTFSYEGSEIARVAPEAVQVGAQFSKKQMKEIDLHLHSYTEKILLIEEKGRLCGIFPTLFPSSTLTVVLIFDSSLIRGEDILRLVEEEPYKRMFILSDGITMRPSHMSPRLMAIKPRFEAFLHVLSACFFRMDALKGANAKDAREEIFDRIGAISALVGCPVELEYEEDSPRDYRETDLPLFSAFLLCMLCCARSVSPLRKASLSLSSSSSAAKLCVSFESQRSLTLSPVIVEWESISADKNMPFEYLSTDGCERVTFQPIRRDWSYLGLKQRTKFIFE